MFAELYRMQMLLLASALVVAALQVGCSDNPPQSQQSQQEVSSTPPLIFNSSGRLPRKIHGFEIGMSLSYALSQDLGLRNVDGSKPSVSKLESFLVSRSNSPFLDTLGFYEGRLYDINSSIDGISPADASEFDQNTISVLGKPTVELYEGPEAKGFVWIDGDIRTRYEDKPGSFTAAKGSRQAEIEATIYPILLKTASEPNSLFSKTEMITGAKQTWGEELVRPNLKALPRSLENLALGMTPQDVLSAIPGTRLIAWTEHRSRVEDVASEGFNLDVEFWDGVAYSFRRILQSVNPKDFPALHQRLLNELGTPITDSASLGSMNWEDDATKIDYVLSSGGADPPGIFVSFVDRKLEAVKDEYENSQQNVDYKAVPRKSLF